MKSSKTLLSVDPWNMRELCRKQVRFDIGARGEIARLGQAPDLVETNLFT
jgi:hypothetical protein